jgi:DUF971 family protein
MKRARLMSDAPWPTALNYDRETRLLHVSFDNGAQFALPAELLRVESPSAEVRGHGGAATKQIVRGKQDVDITRMEPVGNYAVRLIFSDGHDSGIFSWATLHDYGNRADALMQAYRSACQ